MSAERPPTDLSDVLKCPITYELFRDPVIGSDGHTYERENITAWIQKHSTSPITREPMDVGFATLELHGEEASRRFRFLVPTEAV